MKGSRMHRGFQAFLLALTLCVLVGINFYADYVYGLIPFVIPEWSIPALSAIVIIVIAYKVYQMQHQADDLRYEFLTIATHKFRTPLTTIKWASRELARHTITHQEQELAVNKIGTATERLIEVIDILVGLAKIDNTSTYTLKSVSFREMVEESLAKYRDALKKKAIKLTIDISSTLPQITVDNKKIQFVVEILIQNAITYTGEHGSIAITTKQSGDAIFFSVRDSGIGMTRRERRHVFSRFYRGDAAKKQDTEGMGLGLYISKKIVARHKGELSVKSEGRGKGSTFTMKLPLSS